MAFLVGGASRVKLWAMSGLTPTMGKITLSTTPTLILDEIEQSQISYVDGNLTLTQLTDDSALYSFIDANMSTSAGQEPTVVNLENGTEKSTGGGSDAKYVAALVYGAKGGNGKRKAFFVHGTLQAGDYTQSNNEFTKPSFSITGVAVPSTYDIEVDPDDVPLLVTHAVITLAKRKKAGVYFLDATP